MDSLPELQYKHIPLVVAAFGLATAILVVLYRLTLHPLAKHPGPFWGKLTDVYTMTKIAQGDRHVDFYRLHEKYGPVVRYGPNRISINAVDGLKQIYGAKASTQKSKWYSAFTHVFKSDSTQTTVDPKLHGIKRRVISQAVSENAVRAMEPHITKNIKIFCEKLGENDQANRADSKGWSSPKKMSDWANYYTFDVMGDVVFSRNFDMLKNPDNRFVLNVLSEGIKGLYMVGYMQIILKLQMDKWLFTSLDKDLKRYEAFSKAQSDERMKTEPKTRDAFSFLLEAKDPETGQKFTTDEMISEAGLLITAGSDTSAASICASLFYLLHNPSCLEKLNSEVRKAFNSIDEIRGGATLSGSTYLRACIDEAMRMSPSVGSILPREVIGKGITIDGVHFPAGTDVGVPQYTLHHNEAYFPDSFAYKPSRWIVGSEPGVTEESVRVANSAYCPFSIGPRGCVGKAMAYREMMMTLAAIVFTFDLRLVEGETLGEGHPSFKAGRRRIGEFQQEDRFVAKPNGPIVEFKLR